MKLTLERQPTAVFVHRLPPTAECPKPNTAAIWSATYTLDELSIVSADTSITGATQRQGPFQVFRVSGTLDFALTGILNQLTTPLKQAAISCFALSTYDTDYLLVPEADTHQAIEAFRAAGFMS